LAAARHAVAETDAPRLERAPLLQLLGIAEGVYHQPHSGDLLSAGSEMRADKKEGMGQYEEIVRGENVYSPGAGVVCGNV